MSRLKNSPAVEAAPPPLPQPTMISGKWIILAVGGIGLFGAVFGWLYHYDVERTPRDWWGPESWKLFGEAPHVTAMLLDPETPATKIDDWDQGPDGELKLLVVMYGEIASMRYLVTERKEVEREPGMSLDDQTASLREALRYHKSYAFPKDLTKPIVVTPKWRYALRFYRDPLPDIDGRPQRNPDTVLLFDGQCTVCRLLMVDKPVKLQPPISEQFRKFFQTIYPNSAPAGDETLAPDALASGTGSTTPGPASTIVTSQSGMIQPMINSFTPISDTLKSPTPSPTSTATPVPTPTTSSTAAPPRPTATTP